MVQRQLRLPPNSAAPAAQCHTATYHSLHQPPRATLQRYQGLRLPRNVTLVLRLPHNVTLQRTLPCTSHPEPRSNATRMLQSPATKCRTGAAPATQRHAATHMQRIPCTSHPDPHSNATRMLQSTAPATKCHPSLHQPPRATLQRYQDASITCHQMSHWCCACHTTSHCNVHATYHSLHQPPRATLQRYQDASIDCACHQMSHWCCACHTTSQFNVPFPAPATQIHAATGSVTCTSEPISRVQASQFHVYKRTRARKLLSWNLKMNRWFGSMLQPDSKQGSFNNKVAVPTPKCCAKVADSPPGWVSRSFALDEWHQWHSYMQDWPQPLNSWGMEGLRAMLGWWRPVKCWGGAVGIVFVEQFWLKSVFFKSFLWRSQFASETGTRI